MDALKSEIAVKRKTIEQDPILNGSGRPTKYMRRGELERLKEEQERKAKEEKEREQKAKLEAELSAKAEAKSKVNFFFPLSILVFCILIPNSRIDFHSISCCHPFSFP